jgi:cytoskeletal protein CcmA (bactofilin family)
LVIGPAGSVKGDIICNTADIQGKFEGKIKIEDTLNVKESASIVGEVEIGKLSVEPGATFNASCVMFSKNDKSKSSDNE